ncbi:MAG: hypothetical protein A2855_02655 [Candidatus Liptonbacteria bacterium RIFCSPHIGHO2_01_FULL_57_28]|uniref:Uncharacterized protein n=1 Tax=Candidatus Liptonbacteria bacterium RIFCSPHIGHO2_01_FULL_57_28 TaxID=1798647 RepID=A0A1G2CAK6_9BACT|nr:MAG: hypothetical protein A2855_02655 [Candidatus Liptonbacteria bacterium RIFCSPHIGHO2_01_FULL_57_28]
MKTSKKVGIGVGLAAAAAAAAAGAYFLYGKDGAKNRKAVKGWMLKARGEVMEKMEKLDKISETKYKEIVDSVVRGYKSARKASPAELAMVAAELKSHWNSIRRSFKATKPKAKARPRRKARN